MPGSRPRYLVIEEALRRMIAERRPGDLIPSDTELASRFGVSRMTARQATQRLAQEGALYRVSGVGTFIAQPPIRRPVSQLLSFSEEMRVRGTHARSKVLAASVRPGTPEESLALRVRPGDRLVHIRRLRLANDVPIAVQSTILPISCVPILDADLETGSLHDALRAIDRIPTHAEGGLGAEPADSAHAELLGLTVGSPVLIEHLTVFDQHGEPLEVADTRYAGGRYVFDVELGRAAAQEPAQIG